ncbi:unnamed protein product [Schistosoma mattheei]|uniref:adenosine deaminase n=1 Tax=Schistosoma mattheei TaxID=31246 RepID=A0A183NGJ0_9TREM|nr:unnamed protein product [Schistosoma mattheei]
MKLVLNPLVNTSSPTITSTLLTSVQGFLSFTQHLFSNKITLKKFVEDCVKRGGLCYVETRYCPFLLTDSKCTAEEVLKTILDALNRASKKHGIEVRSILSIMRHMPETAKETLELAKNYQPHGVVAIDIADMLVGAEFLKLQRVPEEIVQTFENAKKANIHRTVHVGENSPASSVYEAVNNLYAERIGHGYHILDDENAYKSLLETGVHFEVRINNNTQHILCLFSKEKKDIFSLELYCL